MVTAPPALSSRGIGCRHLPGGASRITGQSGRPAARQREASDTNERRTGLLTRLIGVRDGSGDPSYGVARLMVEARLAVPKAKSQRNPELEVEDSRRRPVSVLCETAPAPAKAAKNPQNRPPRHGTSPAGRPPVSHNSKEVIAQNPEKKAKRAYWSSGCDGRETMPCITNGFVARADFTSRYKLTTYKIRPIKKRPNFARRNQACLCKTT